MVAEGTSTSQLGPVQGRGGELVLRAGLSSALSGGRITVMSGYGSSGKVRVGQSV